MQVLFWRWPNSSQASVRNTGRLMPPGLDFDVFREPARPRPCPTSSQCDCAGNCTRDEPSSFDAGQQLAARQVETPSTKDQRAQACVQVHTGACWGAVPGLNPLSSSLAHVLAWLLSLGSLFAWSGAASLRVCCLFLVKLALVPACVAFGLPLARGRGFCCW